MDKLATKRAMTFKSQIPVPIRKPSNLTSSKREFSGKQSLPLTSNCNKLEKNSQCVSKQLGFKSKPQEIKSLSNNTSKENKICSSMSQTSNSDRTASKNSNIKVKKEENKTRFQVKADPLSKNYNVFKENKKCCSVAQTLSNDKVKEVRNGTRSQAKIDPLLKSYNKSKISKSTPIVSQTTNHGKTAAVNFHPIKKEYIKESCQPEKFVNAKNVTKLENKFASCKKNTLTAEKVSLNTKPVNGTSEEIIEKNQEMESCFPAQKDIKFEVSEFNRNRILCGKGLSPSICKIDPGIRVSSVRAQRPSAYQKFEVHPDPYQDALQAIADLTARRASRSMSTQKDQRKLSRTAQSVFEGRQSFYTPCANPMEDFMRSLEALKARRLQKSALKSSKKKVTFNLHVEEYTSKIDDDSESLPSKKTEAKLTEISERSEETTPISPVKNKVETVNLKSNEHEPECAQINATILTANTGELIHSSVRKGCENYTSPGKPTITSREVQTCILPVKPSLSKEISPVISHSLSTCDDTKLTYESLNSHRTYGILFERNTNGQGVKKSSQTKLYTPRPVSFYSNSRFLNGIPSPEFLAGKTILPNLAPIYTPLALKNMAKSSATSPDADLSPVRMKLDFAATGNDTPLKENFVRRNTLSNFQQIVTVQKKLDDLADRECSFWLPESTPVVCGRHLQNPIAITLTEGDEMHFLPIRL